MNNASIEYRPDIDGLRALAVIPVILFHAGLGCPGGYVGVDIFFVISGYLITKILYQNITAQGGRFSFLSFWERRVRRLFPPLAVVMAVTAAVATFLMFGDHFKELGQSIIAQLFLMANVFFWRKSGYFDAPTEDRPLLHTWSLAVEEQFYLIYPLLLWLAIKYFPRSLWRLILAGIILSFILSVYGTYRHASACFYLLPFRAWELLLGGLVACSPVWAPRRSFREAAAAIGITLIFLAIFFYTPETRFPGVAAALPCVGAALLIWIGQSGPTALSRIQASAPLVFIGKISYSLYLWHWPLIVLWRFYSPYELQWQSGTALISASFILSVITWKFVETPFREKKYLTSSRQLMTGVVAMSSLLLAWGILVSNQTIRPAIPQIVEHYALAANDRAPRQMTEKENFLGTPYVPEVGDPNGQSRLLIWGDSHAGDLMGLMDQLGKEYRVRVYGICVGGLPPVIGRNDFDKAGLNGTILDYIKAENFSGIILSAWWPHYIRKDGGSPETLGSQLHATMQPLHQLDSRIWIFKCVPEYPVNVPRALARLALRGPVTGNELSQPEMDWEKQASAANNLLEAHSSHRVEILDPKDLFFFEGRSIVMGEKGEVLYRDNHHLTSAGTSRLRPLFEPLFRSLAEEDQK